MGSHVVRFLVAAFTVAALSQAVPAHAQDAVPAGSGDDVKGNIAGTIGLGMLGAELGLILTPTVGLHDQWWAWVLFPAVGAAGGAVAGALAFEPRDPSPAVTVSLLGAGFLLAVPAIVGAAAIKNKRQNREAKESLQQGGVLRFGKVDRRWGVPAVASAQAYSAAEQQRFGLKQRNVLNVALVSGRF